jgi:hypothetical protein
VTRARASAAAAGQMSRSLHVDARVTAARRPANLFGVRVGGAAAHGAHYFAAADDGTVWVWDRAAAAVERRLLALDARHGAWVRPLLVRDVPDPRGGTVRRRRPRRPNV